MEIQNLQTNGKVSLLREIAISFENKKIVMIPDNQCGIKQGQYSAQELLYFLADMLEE